jgi:predicted dehydrogenase
VSAVRGGALRIGLAGRRGAAFVAGFRAIPGVEVSALCETDGRLLSELADRHEIPGRFPCFEAMLNAVDAVVVATPMQLHVPQALLALGAGKHVLSEVTAAVSLEECWRLLDAVRASGAVYMMAENYCYLRENVLVREMVRKGLFGELYYGEGDYLHEIRNLHHGPDGRPTWRYYWQVGVRGCTYPTHSLGPVMQWFTAADPDERIESVVCLGSGRHTDPEHPHDDTCVLLCRLRSGKLVRVRLDMLSNRPHQMAYYALQGTRGVYEASRFAGEEGRVWIGESRAGERREWRPLSDFAEHLPEAWRHPPAEALRAGHGGGDFYQVRDFVRAIREGTPPPVDVYTALEWTAAGLCSQLSIANGGVPVRVPDFRNPHERPVTPDGRTPPAAE